MQGTHQSTQKKTVQWLLERSNPSVRYIALKYLQGKKEADADVEDAKAVIPASKIVEKILSRQRPEGYWEDRYSPYHPKYKSTYWQVMTLSQLGMDKSDVRVQNACEFVFGLQLEEGGFSSYTAEGALQEYEWMRTKTALKEKLQPEPEAWAESLVHEHEYSCLTGNLCAAMLRMGYAGDPRLTKALNWLVKVQNQDGGWLCPNWKAHVKDTHGCFYGTMGPLEAFSEVPEPQRSSEMQKAIDKSVEFMLMHHLYKADHHGYRTVNRSWLKLSFPWFYAYHILRGLSALTKLGFVDDERLADAVGVLIQKRCQDGTWLLEGAPAGRLQANIENVGEPSKWITLDALITLKRLQETSTRQVKKILATA